MFILAVESDSLTETRLGCSAGDAATVDDQRLAGHEGGLVGGQKQHRVSDLLGGADATERSVRGTGSVLLQDMPRLAASSGSMGVCTSPGHTQFTRIPSGP